MIVTGEQLRAGRALIRMDQTKLAATAKVSVDTIKRLEGMSGPVSANITTVAAIQQVLSDAGVIFIDENGEGPGVRLRKV